MSVDLIRRLEELSVELADARREVAKLKASETSLLELFNRTAKVSCAVRELQKAIVFVPGRREWVIDDLCVDRVDAETGCDLRGFLLRGEQCE